eukprot:TRINITY_DN41313_c0_g1_i5.p1 TRINITY_DN41313_c0_g1~~TRINITY_DN41313_c0_g1_i5.p1  ORF type:complete len:1040 (+),score=251.64 TRINITY_DN41313_c0_g1_i5:142-3120(+)
MGAQARIQAGGLVGSLPGSENLSPASTTHWSAEQSLAATLQMQQMQLAAQHLSSLHLGQAPCDCEACQREAREQLSSEVGHRLALQELQQQQVLLKQQELRLLGMLPPQPQERSSEQSQASLAPPPLPQQPAPTQQQAPFTRSQAAVRDQTQTSSLQMPSSGLHPSMHTPAAMSRSWGGNSSFDLMAAAVGSGFPERRVSGGRDIAIATWRDTQSLSDALPSAPAVGSSGSTPSWRQPALPSAWQGAAGASAARGAPLLRAPQLAEAKEMPQSRWSSAMSAGSTTATLQHSSLAPPQSAQSSELGASASARQLPRSRPELHGVPGSVSWSRSETPPPSSLAFGRLPPTLEHAAQGSAMPGRMDWLQAERDALEGWLATSSTAWEVLERRAQALRQNRERCMELMEHQGVAVQKERHSEEQQLREELHKRRESHLLLQRKARALEEELASTKALLQAKHRREERGGGGGLPPSQGEASPRSPQHLHVPAPAVRSASSSPTSRRRQRSHSASRPSPVSALTAASSVKSRSSRSPVPDRGERRGRSKTDGASLRDVRLSKDHQAESDALSSSSQRDDPVTLRKTSPAKQQHANWDHKYQQLNDERLAAEARLQSDSEAAATRRKNSSEGEVAYGSDARKAREAEAGPLPHARASSRSMVPEEAAALTAAAAAGGVKATLTKKKMSVDLVEVERKHGGLQRQSSSEFSQNDLRTSSRLSSSTQAERPSPVVSSKEEHLALTFTVHLEEMKQSALTAVKQRDLCAHLTKVLGCDLAEVVRLQEEAEADGCCSADMVAVGFPSSGHAARASDKLRRPEVISQLAWGSTRIPEASIRQTMCRHRPSNWLQARQLRSATMRLPDSLQSATEDESTQAVTSDADLSGDLGGRLRGASVHKAPTSVSTTVSSRTTTPLHQGGRTRGDSVTSSSESSATESLGIDHGGDEVRKAMQALRTATSGSNIDKALQPVEEDDGDGSVTVDLGQSEDDAPKGASSRLP